MEQESTKPVDSTGSVRVAPIPSWVKHADFRSVVPTSAEGCISSGLLRVLFETQIDLSADEPAWHNHWVQRVLTRQGAEKVSHFLADFDPAFERLEVHSIRVLRGDEKIEHAGAAALQLLRRETNLEKLALDGRLSASLLIPDVRVDDYVEVSFTVYGANPALNGIYSAWLSFDDINPWVDFCHRVLRPFRRSLSSRSLSAPPAAEVSSEGEIEITTWHLAQPAPRLIEDYTPPWTVVTPSVQLTEFKGWQDVARLMLPYYGEEALPAGMASVIRDIATKHEDQAKRAAEWLRVVQTDIRYFALSLGQGGWIPRSLEAIWSSRFGDCKDAAKLYVAGARALGLDACAALCSTRFGMALRDWSPAPIVFDHCIVRLRLDGKTYWLDPTLRRQCGALKDIYCPHTGWVLALSEDATDLEAISDSEPIHLVNVDEEIRFARRIDAPAQYRRQSEFYSLAADELRERISGGDAAELCRQRLRELQSVWPGISQVGEMEVHDDREENCLTTVLNYEIRNCWKKDKGSALKFDSVDNVLPRELGFLGAVDRKSEIYLGQPRRVTRTLRMVMPGKWPDGGWVVREEAAGLNYENRVESLGQTVVNRRELIVSALSMPAAQAADYSRVVGRVHESLLTVAATSWFGRIRPKVTLRRVLGSALAIGLGLALAFQLLAAVFALRRALP